MREIALLLGGRPTTYPYLKWTIELTFGTDVIDSNHFEPANTYKIIPDSSDFKACFNTRKSPDTKF